MDEKKRPVGRKKTVAEGTVHAGRREGGPVGSEDGQKSQERLDASDLANLANLAGSVMGSSSGSSSSGKKRSPMIAIIAVVAMLLLGGGGSLSGLLSGLLGGGTTTDPVQSVVGALTGGQTTGQTVTGKLDTTVAAGARDKRVVLAGDGTDTTTILVYMCGTDLESNGGFATKDLQEMMSADLGGNIDLLVFTGGCKSWKTPQISASKNQIFQIQSGKLSQPLWESKSLRPMTDPDTLSGFIQWAVKNHPADRYCLIFWDHGGGSLSGYGYDEVNKSSGSMTLDGVAKALKDGGCTFDFIGFDACLMATLETALVVEPYADYLIASEETEPGCGWYYTPWLNALAQEPSMSALNIGKNIADSFVSSCAQVAPRQQATLSVIDLAELSGTVPESFRTFAQATGQSVKQKDYQAIATARGNTKEFAQSNNLDQIDLIHLADNMNTKESKALAKVLRSAVKYNATSSNIQNANGVSIYFPYGKTSGVNTASRIYDQIGLDSAYTDCIKSFASLEVAGQAAAGGSAAQLDSLFNALLGGSSGSSGDAVGQLLGALLQGRNLPNVGLEGDQADFLDSGLIEQSQEYLTQNRFDPSTLTWTEKGGQRALVLTEEQWALVQDIELNVFVDDGEGYIDLGLDNVFDLNADGDLLGEYDGTWLTVNGQVVAVYMLETNSDTGVTLARIPAMLNGQKVDLMVSFAPDNDGEVLGAALRYDEDAETATVARGLIELQDGDVIDFICGYYDYGRSYQDDYYLGDSLTVSGPLKLANMRLDNNAYIAAYRLSDIYQNHYWTPSV